MTDVVLIFDLGPGDEQLFIDESLEQIEAIESGLLRLERGEAGADEVNAIFRGAHTLKGSAGAIRHRRMAELTHALEDVFGALRSGTLAELGPFADTALSTIDVLRDLVDEVTAGRVLTESPEGLTSALRTMLDQAIGAVAADGLAGAPQAAAAPNGRGAPVTAAGLGAGDPARRLVAEAPASAGPRSVVRCVADPESPWQAVRLLQAAMEAGDSGILVASSPTMAEIETGLVDGTLTLLVAADVDSLDGLLDRLRAIDEIVEVLAEPAPLEGAGPASAGARAAGTGEDVQGAAPGDGPSRPNGDRPRANQQTIRIDVARLDELMNLVGELVVQKTRFAHQASQLRAQLGDDAMTRGAEEGAQQLARITSQLQDQVTGLRMLPIETVFNRFPRVVRDLASRLGKDVELVIEGKETELDRSVLEEVGDPLSHLVRNALDHGVELPAIRIAAGKPALGRVRLAARHADGQIEISVEDDGAGLDADALRRSAVAKGLLAPEAAAALSESEALRIIFMPGFSTAQTVTDVSGRGVGMDVVRTNIERLGGRVDISTRLGAGTRVTLSLPLTLAIISAMLVRSGGRVCALPLTGVVETLRVAPASVTLVGRQQVATLRGRVLPVVMLDAALGDSSGGLRSTARGFVNLVVVRARDTEVALAVDEFVGQQEIVLKSLDAFAGHIVGISGATIMADGTVGLVVDIPALIGGIARPLSSVA